MADTVTLEAHPVRIDREAFCPACLTWSATSCDIALVSADTLELIARLNGLSCPCGFEDHHRLT